MSATRKTVKRTRIMIVSSVPGTLWSFYLQLLERLQASDFDLTVASSPDALLYKIRDHIQCSIFPVTITRRISPLKDLAAAFKLFKELKSRQYDIVHAHTPKAGLVAMIAAFLARVPNRIYTVHGLPFETMGGWQKTLLKYMIKLTCRLATSVLVVSESLTRVVIREGVCSPDSIRMLGHGSACGVDLTVFNPDNKSESIIRRIRKEVGIPFDATVVGFVGRLVPDKGVECLLKSLEIAKEQVENIWLLIIGDYDSTRQSVDDTTRSKIENNERIVLAGRKENIVPYYYAMDMLALPSRREGFSYVLLEAAASGLCAVTTKATGCLDGVVSGQTGFVVDVDDHEQFADKIVRLAQNPAMRKEFGQKGLERVRELFSSTRLIDEHMTLYADILRD